MSYSVTIFHNSGFNAENSPISPILLNTVSKTVLDSLEVLQDCFLPFVKVRASWSTVKDVDYAQIGDWYYAVTGIAMEAVDVARLELKTDFILSAGGVGNLNFLDGITERVHVATNDDLYGAYCADDELTNPSQPLEIGFGYTQNTNANMTLLVESTVDLHALATTFEALKFETNLGEDVIVPELPAISTFTKFYAWSTDAAQITRGTRLYCLGSTTNGTLSYNTAIVDGLARARSLGVESAIVSTYAVPTSLFTGTIQSDYGYDEVEGNFTVYSNSLASLAYELASYGTIHNKRVFYGKQNKYGILAMSGDSVEFNAEEVYNSGDTAPSVVFLSDVRCDGRPYMRFRHYLHDDGKVANYNLPSDNFWRNCISGADWQTVPVMYTGKSGSELNRFNYDSERQVIDVGYQTARDVNIIQGVSKLLGGIAGGSGLRWDANATLDTSGVLQTGVGMLAKDMAMSAVYNAQKDSSLASFLANQQIVAPEINFPYNTDILRDALGNGFMCYRYRYTQFDAQRIDKLLTMYGYKVIKSLEATDFTNRAKFNYVKAHNVSVADLPMWFANGIAEQLSAGIRFWHVLPDTSFYTNGQNV